ncbi:MAG: tRNA (N6-threonylcarbamoyladenosine(37)-N6)-methyltransferase TrmO [Chloroflexota bacterium]
MSLICHPIGVIHTPHTALAGMPIQPSGAADAPGTIELLPEFHAGLQDLDGFSHILLLYHFHRSHSFALTVVPFLDTEPRGLFATRAPRRPNPIGLSVVRLQGIVAGVLYVTGVDMLDGTPLLDIKPYVPDFDVPPITTTITTGWLAQTARQASTQQADDRFQSQDTHLQQADGP